RMRLDHAYTKNALPGGGLLQRMIFKVAIMFMVLTTLTAVILRLWAKLRTGKRKLAVDDYSMLTAWILTLGEVMFMLSTIFLKISLMLFYRQFVWKKWQRRAIIVAGGCSIILSLIALFLSLFQCGTLKHIAHRQISGKCVQRNRFVPLLYLHGATGAVTDWAFALLPVSVLIKSSLKTHIKLSVCILLTLGVTGSVAACFRTAYVYGVWFDPAFLDPTAHISFYDHSAPEIVLALTELGFGISAASLACLQPLFRHLVHKSRNWIQRRFSDESDNTTGAVRSHMGLLPQFELRARNVVGPVLKQAQVQACEAPTPEFPPHPAVRRHGFADTGSDPSNPGDVSLSRRKSSHGVLPTCDGMVEAGDHQEHHRKSVRQRKPSLLIGVLPTIATETGAEEEDYGFGQMVADPPIQATFKIDDDDDRISRMDSQAAMLH
ncbi:unnamed protein product, partial [Aureobasidium uvarum]